MSNNVLSGQRFSGADFCRPSGTEYPGASLVNPVGSGVALIVFSVVMSSWEFSGANQAGLVAGAHGFPISTGKILSRHSQTPIAPKAEFYCGEHASSPAIGDGYYRVRYATGLDSQVELLPGVKHGLLPGDSLTCYLLAVGVDVDITIEWEEVPA